MLYGRDTNDVVFLAPALAVGWVGDMVFIELAWLHLAIGFAFNLHRRS